MAYIDKGGLLQLNDKELAHAVRLGVRGALLGVHNAASIHYSQAPDRWEGIDHRLRSYKGQFPRHADCSSYVTWVLWDCTRRFAEHFKDADFVNGQHWQAGHTGTLVHKGERVSLDRLRPLDLVFYGDEGWRPEHVAVVVRGGDRHSAMVVSNGSEPGPFYLPVAYRTDIAVGKWVPRRYVH